MNNYGFHHPHPLMYLIAIIGILSAIAIPNLQKYMEKSYLARDVSCIKTMVAIVQGADIADAKCPVSGLAYQPFEVDGQLSVSCPDPAHHLESWPEITYSDHGIIFEQAFFEFDSGSNAIINNTDRITLVEREDAVLLTRRMGWERYILLSVAVVFLVSGFVFPLIIGISEFIHDKGIIFCSFISVLCTITILICVLIIRPVFKTQVYRFSKSDRFVDIQSFYVGKRFSDPEIISDIIAVVPLRLGEERMALSILYETTQGIQYKKLGRLNNENLGIVTVLNQALFNGATLAATGTHAAPTAILQSN